MGERIAMGFHTTVDYELIWDLEAVEKQIQAFDIRAKELRMDIEADCERSIWIICLAHLKDGIGGEMVPGTVEDCMRFASHFQYKVTLGGTATRAAIALERLGYSTALQTSCYNEHVKQLMPSRVHVLPGVEAGHDTVYPHIILQCSGGVRIHANDIDFVTPRENRIMVSRDMDSLNVPVLPDTFGKMITDAEVFLLGCFSEVIDKQIMKGCVEKTKALLSHLKNSAFVVMEDGCYAKKELRYYVHKELAPVVDVLSMNEDELQEYVGRRIDILNPQGVKEALEEVYRRAGIKMILVHSAAWALAYSENALNTGAAPDICAMPGKRTVLSMRTALEDGILMASTRFRIGDEFTLEDYEDTKRIPDRADSIIFCKEINELLGDKICCVPCKDLSGVEHPTVVGLGDSFAGGLLPGLLLE